MGNLLSHFLKCFVHLLVGSKFLVLQGKSKHQMKLHKVYLMRQKGMFPVWQFSFSKQESLLFWFVGSFSTRIKLLDVLSWLCPNKMFGYYNHAFCSIWEFKGNNCIFIVDMELKLLMMETLQDHRHITSQLLRVQVRFKLQISDLWAMEIHVWLCAIVIVI